ncbi:MULTISPECIES: HAD family hydrolase [Deefgea]|uniref:HAD-IA family hydrolase n=1 Tax=Deefgea chitinilytica TaxID=570276 RepID=A0ABS2CBR6_9NEIS|nr:MULTISPECIES: HAD-IA family hydrolase [Deefgea]MBM5571090.1 HAD-IA family hydrolase [Deefgea chitinilytica]MBM9888320.1 HAD-IA family hydrolase [Deefgea sp. CFH1-16]
MNSHIRAVLFDLDGTLADTAPDLGAALNRLLIEKGQAPQPYSAIRPLASHGARGLIELGFGITPNDTEFAALRERFLDLYEQSICDETILFDGIHELIEQINERGLAWGIITNKPMRFTDPLVELLPLPIAPQTCVSGDTVGIPKPNPAPMLHAAAQLGIDPAHCLYVGDAERDIEAGRAVGMQTVLANYGYISETDDTPSWGADIKIEHPLELLAHLPLKQV